jgi:hypothetical protein
VRAPFPSYGDAPITARASAPTTPYPHLRQCSDRRPPHPNQFAVSCPTYLHAYAPIYIRCISFAWHVCISGWVWWFLTRSDVYMSLVCHLDRPFNTLLVHSGTSVLQSVFFCEFSCVLGRYISRSVWWGNNHWLTTGLLTSPRLWLSWWKGSTKTWRFGGGYGPGDCVRENWCHFLTLFCISRQIWILVLRFSMCRNCFERLSLAIHVRNYRLGGMFATIVWVVSRSQCRAEAQTKQATEGALRRLQLSRQDWQSCVHWHASGPLCRRSAGLASRHPTGLT